MNSITIAKRYTFLAFLLFLSLSSLTPSLTPSLGADTLSYAISEILGDGDSSIEIPSDPTPSWRAILDQNAGGTISSGDHWVRLYYRYSPFPADFIHRNGSLKCVTRMGLSPLVGASLVYIRINLVQRWPLLITIAVILSVLLYMEILIRRHRKPRTKRPYPPGVSHTYPAHNVEA